MNSINEIHISNPTQEDEWPDPFMKSWDDIRGLGGLSANFKRSRTRLVKSEYTESYKDSAKTDPEGKGAESKAINPGEGLYANGYGLFDVITPPYSLTMLSSYYDTSFPNHAAVDAKVATAVGAGFDFDMANKAKQRLQEIKDKDQQDKFRREVDRIKVETTEWLDELNDQDPFIDTMTKVLTDLEATGNGYIEVGRTVRGRIGYLGHVPATTIRVRRMKDGFVQIIGRKAVFFRNFGADIPDQIGDDPNPNEIIHLKKYSPLNTYYGVPDIISAITSVAGDQQAETYNYEYFQNKAVPRYIATLKGAKLAPEAEEKLFKFLQTNLRGQNHRTLFIPLPPDTDGNKVEFKLEPVENKIQDSSFDAYRQNNRDNILMAHQVPLIKLGVSTGTGVAAALSQDRTFRDSVVRPLQSYLEKIIKKVVREFTDMVQLKFNEMNIVDEVQQSTIHEIYLEAGVVKPNEVREEIGKPQIEGLDEEKERLEKERFEREAQAKTEQQTSNRDARDRERTRNASDSPSSATGRNPKGSGSKE